MQIESTVESLKRKRSTLSRLRLQVSALEAEIRCAEKDEQAEEVRSQRRASIEKYATRFPHSMEEIEQLSSQAPETDDPLAFDGWRKSRTYAKLNQMQSANHEAAKEIIREDFLHDCPNAIGGIMLLEDAGNIGNTGHPYLELAHHSVAEELMEGFVKHVLSEEERRSTLWGKILYLHSVLFDLRKRAAEWRKGISLWDYHDRPGATRLHYIHQRVNERLEYWLDYALQADRLGLVADERSLTTSGSLSTTKECQTEARIIWKGTDHQLAYLIREVRDKGFIGGGAYWKTATAAFCRPDDSPFDPDRLRTAAGKGAPNTEADTIDGIVGGAVDLGDVS